MDMHTETPRILITGASGSYGRLLTQRLLEKSLHPSNLILLSRDPARLSQATPSQVTVRQASFDDALEALTSAFHGADIVFLVSTSRVGGRVLQHQNAINAAVKAGVQHIFYTGFIGADLSNHAALVVGEHRATEEMLRKSGLAFTVLRDSQYADVFADLIVPSARETGVLKTNCGSGRIAPVSKEDCVEVAATVLMDPEPHRNKTYNITGPELVSYGEVVELANQHYGEAVKCEQLSDEEMFAHFDALGVPREPSDHLERIGVKGYTWHSSDMVSFGTAIRLGEMEVLSGDVEQIIARKPTSLLNVLKSRG